MSKPMTPSFYLTVGVLSFPVKSYVAARDAYQYLPSLHSVCGTQIKRSTFCPTCNKEAEESELVKGIARGDGFATVRTEDVKALASEKTKTMEVLAFVSVSEVDPVYLGRTNYLAPSERAAVKPFSLLMAGLAASGKAGLVKYVERGHDKIGLLRAYVRRGDAPALMLHELFYDYEVRPFRQENKLPFDLTTPERKELGLMLTLIATYKAPFSMEGRVDGVYARMNNMIAEHLASPAKPSGTRPTPKTVVPDMMETLRKSIATVDARIKQAAKPARKRSHARQG